jgi:hypothetical protein
LIILDLLAHSSTGEHLHHADQRADHAEGRRAIADRTVDFLALVQRGEEVVSVALEIIADELGIVAVGGPRKCP